MKDNFYFYALLNETYGSLFPSENCAIPLLRNKQLNNAILNLCSGFVPEEIDLVSITVISSKTINIEIDRTKYGVRRVFKLSVTTEVGRKTELVFLRYKQNSSSFQKYFKEYVNDSLESFGKDLLNYCRLAS